MIWSAKRIARARSASLRTTHVNTGRHKACRAKAGAIAGRLLTA
jgi:hypothetical protein